LGVLTVYGVRCQLCAARFRVFRGRREALPRRNYDRVCVSFPVWVKRRPALLHQMGYEGRLEDLSLRGCRIRCDGPFTTGARVEMEFQYAESAFPITIDEAIVKRVTEDEVGLRFTQLHREDQRRLSRILEVWLSDQPIATR